MSAPERTNYETAAGAARDAALAAFAALQEANTASDNADTTALVRAMEAGDAAIALEEFAPKRQKQKFLTESTDAKLATIKVCMKLARGRHRIEEQMASASQMSIRVALRLLRPEKREKQNRKAPSTAALRKFFDDVGAEAFYRALTEKQKDALSDEGAGSRQSAKGSPSHAAKERNRRIANARTQDNLRTGEAITVLAAGNHQDIYREQPLNASIQAAGVQIEGQPQW